MKEILKGRKNNMKKLLAIVGITLLLSSCGSTSRYSFPGNGTICEGGLFSKKCYNHYGHRRCFDKYCW